MPAQQADENQARNGDTGARQPESLRNLAPVTAFVGHAGVGKTNLVLNLALAQARSGKKVAVADMDLVNPYFRSSDYPELLEQAGVRLIAPTFARTTLDTPSLNGDLDVTLRFMAAAVDGVHRPMDNNCPDCLIIDVGGDDIGATGLGRYAAEMQAAHAKLYYVVNAFRNLTQTPQEAAELLPGIEQNCHLKACGIVNTSNLMEDTTAADVAHGRTFAAQVAHLTGLPLVATSIPAAVTLRGETVAAKAADKNEGGEELLVMERLVVTPWG